MTTNTQILGLQILICHSIALNTVVRNLFKDKSKPYLKAIYVVTLDRELKKVLA